MTLHEAIHQVLIKHGGPMTTREIADELNWNGFYSKKDGSFIIPYQIHGRVKNYPHLFDKQGSVISLKSKTGIKPVSISSKRKLVSGERSDRKPELLMHEKNFKSASQIDELVPIDPGIYAIRISDINKLPYPFNEVLETRGHNIIYIGLAAQSLAKRMLGQELRARGHGTFFRSLGAMLGYRPAPGSLVNKRNKNNFTFPKSDEKKIIDWINENLLINWVVQKDNLNELESILIPRFQPLLNIAKNPSALNELTRRREECLQIARH
ncbi:MAG: HTH domain-containing protein [Cyclobacteriaceae bacterium]